MINLSKSSSSLIVTSDDKNTFPFKDGTLSLPMNSLYFVLDESEYVSFKQATDNNQLFGASLKNITINGTQATRENIISLFDSVANSTNGGGGGEGGAVDSVNGQVGAVIITPQNIGTYTSQQIDSKLDEKQNSLISGTNIKTINNQSLLGEGNIEIVSEGGIEDAPNDGKLYGRKDEQWSEIDTSNFATKDEIPTDYLTEENLEGYLTKEEANGTYQPKGDYALKSDIPNTENLVTDEQLNSALETKANASDLSNYLTNTDAQSTYATKAELGAKLDVSTYNEDKATFALKTEIPDTSDMLTKEEAEDTYRAIKIYNFNRTNTCSDITAAWANNVKNIGATFQNVSFDEGATYNNVLYCGYRSYDGGGTRKGVGITEIDGKLRSVIFEFSGTNCVATLGDDTIDLSDYATIEQLNGKQDTLISGTNIKTINGASILGEGNITIETPQGGISDAPQDGNTYARKDGTWTAITIPSLDGYITEAEADDKFQPKGNYITEIPSEYVTDTELNSKGYITEAQADEAYQPKGDYLTEIPSEYVTDTELEEKGYATQTSLDAESTERQKQDTALGGMIAAETEARESAVSSLQSKDTELEGNIQSLETSKQDALVSGTNIKTINSQSLLGEGNIEITVEGGIAEAPNDGKLYGRKNEAWAEVDIPDTTDFATKEELSQKADASALEDYMTIESANDTFQPKGDYITEIPSEYVTDTELNSKGYITEAEANETFQPKGDYATKEEIPSTTDFATKTELSEGLSTKANSSDLSNYLTKTEASDNYADKSSVEGLQTSKLDVSTYNADKPTFALKSSVPTEYVSRCVVDDNDLTFYQEGNSDSFVSISFGEGLTTELSKTTLIVTAEGGGDDITSEFYTASNGFQISKNSANLISVMPQGGISFTNSGSNDSPIVTISLKEWVGTSEEYNSLPSKDENTTYYITDEL